MTPPRSLVEDLVARGVDDWVYDAEVLDIVSRCDLEAPSDRRTVAIGLVAEVLIGGLMKAGTVSEDGFIAWACSPADAVSRVAREWLSRADPLVMPGEIVWLKNTARGTELGETVLRRELG
jgi:hypothetical protein